MAEKTTSMKKKLLVQEFTIQLQKQKMVLEQLLLKLKKVGFILLTVLEILRLDCVMFCMFL